jgi:hypothetical protein
MKTYGIYWNDLTEEAKEGLKKEGFWHENINLMPLVVLEIEKDSDG